jgi:hypothetical protein
MNDPRSSLFQLLGFNYAIDPNAAAKYRALRALAVDANDHIREMEFLANEMRARRFWHDKPFGFGSGRFWVGWLYEKLSDFGRSIWRPLYIWFALQMIYAVIYFAMFLAGQAPQNEQIWNKGCVSGTSSPALEALFLSLSNSVVVGGVNSERLKITQACLFGVENVSQGLSGVPSFPVTGAIISLFQTFFSVILIFLFVLSAMNYFKIK